MTGGTALQTDQEIRHRTWKHKKPVLPGPI